MSISENELGEISHIIGGIYDTILNEALWPSVLERICRHVHGKASRIYWRDASNGQAQTVFSWGFNPEFIRAHGEKYAVLNPLYPASVFVKPGEVFSSRDLVPSEEFEASRFFLEWAQPQGFFDAAIFNIQRYQASAAAFTIITGPDYGLVDERMRERLRVFAPHLQRAVLIRREVNTGQQRTQSLESALDQVEAGVFVLDAAGRAVWTNRAAKQLLGKGDMLRAGPFSLSLADPGADRLLREGLAGAPGRPDLLYDARPALIRMTDAEGREWVACLMRLRQGSEMQQNFERVGPAAQAALFVRRAEAVPPSAIELTARSYGLTAAEVRVLQSALEIDTVADIATTLGLSPNTVKKHLAAIFAKIGVSRRAGLIKAVLSSGSAAPLAGQ